MYNTVVPSPFDFPPTCSLHTEIVLNKQHHMIIQHKLHYIYIYPHIYKQNTSSSLNTQKIYYTLIASNSNNFFIFWLASLSLSLSPFSFTACHGWIIKTPIVFFFFSLLKCEGFSLLFIWAKCFLVLACQKRFLLVHRGCTP